MVAFTIGTVVGPVPPTALAASVDSVLAQTSSDWELVVVDGSTEGEVAARLGSRAAADERIRVVRVAAGASTAMTANEALAASDGRWVALVGPDGLLEPDALAQVATALATQPSAEVLYTDEDCLDGRDGLVDPFLKPNWSPERMRAQDCCGHLAVVARPTFDRVGGFRDGFGAARTYDLLLRATEDLDATAVHHLPAVLYHRCPDEDEDEAADGGDEVSRAAMARAVSDQMARRGVPARVERSDLGPGLRVRRRVPSPAPTVSIVIPTAGTARPVWGVEEPLVLAAVTSLLATTHYPSIEVAVVVDPTTPPAVITALEALDVALVPGAGPFSFSQRCNAGIAATRGEVVVLLNDDVRVEQADWLDVVVGHLQEPDVGVVGPRLRYADGTLQHAGIVLNAQALHIFGGFPDDEPGPHGLLQVDREVSAVTGACLVDAAGPARRAGRARRAVRRRLQRPRLLPPGAPGRPPDRLDPAGHALPLRVPEPTGRRRPTRDRPALRAVGAASSTPIPTATRTWRPSRPPGSRACGIASTTLAARPGCCVACAARAPR